MLITYLLSILSIRFATVVSSVSAPTATFLTFQFYRLDSVR